MEGGARFGINQEASSVGIAAHTRDTFLHNTRQALLHLLDVSIKLHGICKTAKL